MTTNLLSVIEQLVDALKNAEGHKLGCKVHAFGDHCTCGFDAQIEAALAAGKQALEQTQVEACGNCSGSGRMVRDPDIGTDQECFVCNGSGHYAAHPPSHRASTAGEQDRESERAAFEADAEPLGFELLRTTNPNVEPWDDYLEMETGMRWGGWLARAALLSAPTLPVAECKRHKPCEKLQDGYCARCHSEAYP